MSKQDWYSAKTIYKHHSVEDGKATAVFEERVVLFRATSFDEALAKGEVEAKRYAAADSQHCKMLDHFVAFNIHDEGLRDGDEVWSCIRDLDTTDEDFLRRVYDGECSSLTNVPLVRRDAS